MGIYLLRDSLTMWERRYFNIITITALSLLAVFLQHWSSRNWYHLIQFLCFVAFFRVAWRACCRKQKTATLLLTGYSASAAIILYVYLVNVWIISPAGLLMTHFSITHFSYMCSLLACTITIIIRLMDNYNTVEQLSLELANLNKLLDQRVEERTRELKEAQQQKQNMMLNIFHDLRNPVFVLKGYIRKIIPSDGEQKHYKEVVEIRLSQLEQLIEDLFLIEKLENGKLLMNEDYVAVHELMETVAKSSRLTASSDMTITFTGNEDCYVWGDSVRLLQAFQNLAVNALEHLQSNGCLNMTLSCTDESVICVFADNGCGILPEDIPHIFDRYYTSNKRSKGTSTGLGLAIAHELIAIHRGSIKVDSEPGYGTVFTVILPRSETPPKYNDSEELL
jgi:signal transduction histidine kinase